jgi:hypothetical protein
MQRRSDWSKASAIAITGAKGMISKRLFAVGLLGLSIFSVTSTFTPDKALAQGLRQRLRNRLDGDSQNNSTNQQNTNPAANPAQAQAQAPAGGNDVSVVTLETRPGPGGSQMVVTPKGMVVPLPGQGVNNNAVQIYIGGQGGFWYVDKNGQQVDLTPAVHAMQAMQAQAAVNVPQYAPQYPPQYAPQNAQQPQVVNNNYAQPQQGSGGGASALGTATAAGLGAMAGAAIGNSMYQSQVPYGTPIHYGANAMPYYNSGGKPVYINNSQNTAEFNQINNQHNTAEVNQFNNQHNTAEVNQFNNQHNTAEASQFNNQHNIAQANQFNNQHANALSEQQDWYKKQQTAQTSTFKNWQQHGTSNNPFVRSDAEGAQANAAKESGRFGKGAANGGEGGRLGRSAEREGGRRRLRD